MKFQHLFIFVVLVALLTSTVDARVLLNSGDPTWSDGSTDLTIDITQSATVNVNDISTTFPNANDVAFTVELYELDANGNLIPVVLMPRPLNQEIVPVPQGSYLDYSFDIDPVHFGNQAGDYRVDIQIEEGRPDQNIQSQDAVAQLTLRVTDTPVNQPPVITHVWQLGQQPTTTYDVVEGETLEFYVAFSDPENDPLTFTGTGLPSGVTINNVPNPLVRLIEWTPTTSQIGTHQLDFMVSDGNGNFDSEIVTVNVQQNTVPTITVPQGIIFVSEGETYTTQLNPMDGNAGQTLHVQGRQPGRFPGLTLVRNAFLGRFGLNPTIQTLPSGATLDATTGQFSWTIPYTKVIHPNLNRPEAIQFRVCDSLNVCSAWQEASFNIADTNRNVAITSTAPTQATELQQYTYQMVAQDPDTEDVLSYTIQAPVPNGMVINANGLLTWTPAIDAVETSPIIGQPGVYPVTVIVEDGFGSSRQESWDITVQDLGNQNIAPNFTLNSVTVTEGQTAILVPQNVVDVNGDTVTFSLGTTNLPATAVTTFDSVTGRLTWGNTVVGTYNVEIIGDDGNGGVTPVTTTITVNPIQGGNSAPVITFNPVNTNINVVAGTSVEFDVMVADRDFDVVNLRLSSITPLPAGAVFQEPTPRVGFVQSRFSWTPTATDVSTSPREFLFLSTDGQTATQARVFVTVTPSPNQPPVITTVPVTTGRVGLDYEYNVDAFDPEGDVLRYSLQLAADTTMEINQQGVISWTPDAVGSYPVVVAVTDGINTVTQAYTIVVAQGRRSLEIASAKILPEVVSPGDYVSINVRVDNEGGVDVKDLQVKATWYEYGLRRTSGEFDLDHGDEKTENFGFLVPYETQPGIYDLKIWVGNDYFHDTAYRQVVVR